MIKSIRAFFSWRINREMSGINSYWENTVTGERCVHTPQSGTMQPVNFTWLEAATGRAWYYDRFGKQYLKTKQPTSLNEAAKPNAVTHPPHYNSHPSGIECIAVTRHMNFNLGNATKYIWRAGLKGDVTEDLHKAIFYLKDEIARLNGNGSGRRNPAPPRQTPKPKR